MDLFTLYLLSKNGDSEGGVDISLLNQYFDLELSSDATTEQIVSALSEKSEEYQTLNDNIEYYYTRMSEVYNNTLNITE